jgi:hypothetical protein
MPLRLRYTASGRDGGRRKVGEGRALREEEGFYVLPVVDAAEAGEVDVGWRGVEDAFAVGVALTVGGFEEAELAGVVVDEEVGAEDGFVAAEDDVGGGDWSARSFVPLDELV